MIIIPTVQRRKANWIGHILHRSCLLKHVFEEKREKGRRDRKTKKKWAATGRPRGNERIQEIESGITRSHSVENSMCNRLWTFQMYNDIFIHTTHTFANVYIIHQRGCFVLKLRVCRNWDYTMNECSVGVLMLSYERQRLQSVVL
jgi:hypothetical protein